MAEKPTLDPVTFEVLKNSFISSVDQMGEQILRTCYSFVIYNRDFSNGLHDAEGNSAAQGNQDIAVHVGTLHFTCKDVMRAFAGDMHPGDVYAINDPYAGGTHFSDVRLIRPIFADGKIIAFSQSNGHWSDVGGSVPGSFDVVAREMFREGLRITPVRLFDKGRFCGDVARLLASNTRDPVSIIGDIQAQAVFQEGQFRPNFIGVVHFRQKVRIVVGRRRIEDRLTIEWRRGSIGILQAEQRSVAAYRRIVGP